LKALLSSLGGDFLFLGEGRLGCETGVVWMTWNLQGFFKGGGESGSFFIYFM